MIGYFVWPIYRLKRYAKVVAEPEFARLVATSQLIDIREAGDFRAKHILGARNLPASGFKEKDQPMNALSKNKPVIMYEGAKNAQAAMVAKRLKNAGVPEIYILKGGLPAWTGKVKTGN